MPSRSINLLFTLHYILFDLIQSVCRKEPKTQKSFEELVIDSSSGDVDVTYGAVRRSMYDVHLTRWLQFFSMEQFHFLTAENLVANPAQELYKIEQFLGLRHLLTRDVFYFNDCRGFYCMCVDQRKREKHPNKAVKRKCLQSSKGRKHPQVDPSVLKKLRDFFRPHNERLYNMTGIDFGWK